MTKLVTTKAPVIERSRRSDVGTQYTIGLTYAQMDALHVFLRGTLTASAPDELTELLLAMDKFEADM